MRIVPPADVPATAAARVVNGQPLEQTSQPGSQVPSDRQAVAPTGQQTGAPLALRQQTVVHSVPVVPKTGVYEQVPSQLLVWQIWSGHWAALQHSRQTPLPLMMQQR
jgi:hypothetical protein